MDVALRIEILGVRETGSSVTPEKDFSDVLAAVDEVEGHDSTPTFSGGSFGGLFGLDDSNIDAPFGGGLLGGADFLHNSLDSDWFQPAIERPISPLFQALSMAVMALKAFYSSSVFLSADAVVSVVSQQGCAVSLSQLEDEVSKRQLYSITGDAGYGKTVTCKTLTRQLASDRLIPLFLPLLANEWPKYPQQTFLEHRFPSLLEWLMAYWKCCGLDETVIQNHFDEFV